MAVVFVMRYFELGGFWLWEWSEKRYFDGQIKQENYLFFIDIKQLAMLESQKFEQLQGVLEETPALTNILNLIRGIAAKHDDFNTQTFIKSSHFSFLVEELNKLKIPEINQIMNDIQSPHCIVALPIKRQPKFTLFYVIVPQGQKFDWHSHPKMSGISKCIHGHLQLSIIDYRDLKRVSQNQYMYPKNQVKVQDLKANETRNVSTIQPHGFNIHRIQALELSAFFDLLMPDYPDDSCQFLTTQMENGSNLLLRQLCQPTEMIQGWDVYLKQLIDREKHIIKNVILK